MSRLLLIEDDAAICHMLHTFLTGHGFEVNVAMTAREGLDSLYENPPDCLLLDWMLPDASGVRVLKKIRSTDALSELPVLMLTAKAQEEDKVRGLESGADDYLTKPVALKELLARIRALLRRTQRLNADNQLVLGRLRLNPESHIATVDDRTLPVSGKEYDLLLFFMQKPDRVFSRGQLLDQIWGHSSYIEERTVDVHVMRLRKILKPFHLDTALETVRGAGYRFRKDATTLKNDSSLQ